MPEEASKYIEILKSRLDPGHVLLELEKRCEQAGVPAEWASVPAFSSTYTSSRGEELLLRMGFPCGRHRRWRRAFAANARRYLSLNLESLTFLGDYDAVHFRDLNLIEASLIGGYGDTRLPDLPGARRVDTPQMELPEFDELFAESDPEALGSGQQIGFDDAWILQLQPAREGDLVIELGSASPLFNVVAEQGSRMASTPRNRRPLPGGHGRFISLRIEGVDAKRHDDALRILREVSDALFFELDLEYGAVPRLAHSRDAERIRHGNVPLRMAFTKDVPKNPRNKYAEKPLSLYWYGRSARQIPLLQYLAYYQVLEFYFPTYSQRDALTRIRNELLDPRFRAGDDMSLMRIMHLSAGFGKGFGSEREQLRSTVAGCVTEAHLRDFIDANDDLSQHFSGVQKIKGVAHIDVADKRNDLMTSVANRIYDIRCRIVHAKEDGGGGSADLLLPFSEEAYSLHPDIELVRFIAQKALIAGAVQL